MKKLIKPGIMIALIALIFSSCTSTSYVAQAPAYQDDGPVTYQSFYDNLSPYGTWIDYPGYGNVWNPRAEAGFRPYATNGQWRYSNEGWAWQSNYNWGWAPFHYGRWLYDDNYGWLWVPGYDWSPAWVTWGSVDNYYAWAPLMPEVNVGVRYGDWRPHSSYWNVVPREHIGDRNISNVIIHRNNNNNHNNNNNNNNNNNTTVINNNTTNITKNITIINNYNTSRTNNYYAKGPDVNEVEKFTKNRIEPVSFKEVHQINKPNQSGNVMEVYRPVVQNPHPQNAAPRAENNTVGTLPAPVVTQDNNHAINNNNNNTNNGNNNHPNNPTNNNPNPVNTGNNGNNNNAGNNNGQFNNSNNVNPVPHPKPAAAEPVQGTLQPVDPVKKTVTEPVRDNNNQQPNQPVQQAQQPPSRPAQQAPRPDLSQQSQNVPVRPAQNPPRPVQQAQQPVQNPQPHVFRKVDATQTRPIRNENETPVMQPKQQQRNVQHLPVQKAPPPAPANNPSRGREQGRLQ